MIHTRVRYGDGTMRADVPPDELHVLFEQPDNLIWIDLESPSPADLGLVAGIAGWNHFTVEDLTKQGQRAKLEQSDGYAFAVMHTLDYDPNRDQRLSTPEVDLVIGANYVATVHYVPLAHLTEYREHLPQTEAMRANGRDFLLYVLADRLVDMYFPVMDAMLEAVDDLEDRIVANPVPELMSLIFAMKRDGVALMKLPLSVRVGGRRQR